MNYKNLLSIGLISSVLILTACDNDIDLTAPYREIGVLYGLLNPSDTVHVVRIQKAFLGEGNANVMAQVHDSTYYPDILDVQMQRINNGTVTATYPLTRFIGDDKDPGYFPVGPNVLYKTGNVQLSRTSEYKLIIRNTQTGYEFSSTTPIVDSLKITRPSRNPNSMIQFSNPQFPYRVEYLSALNGKITTLTIRFHYTEEVVGSGVPGVPKYIDWRFPSEKVENPSQQETVIIEIPGKSFYQFLGQSIPVIPNVIRYNTSLDFKFETGAEVLANYVEINEATTSIATTIPYYSNVVNGTGIFSSRYLQEVPGKQLDQQSKDLLTNGEYTSDLGFQ